MTEAAERGLAARRLRNQRLEGEPYRGVEDVARGLVALQFQDYPVARWSVGQRAAGLTEAAVDAALAAGTVVRTHVLRETWHLVAAEDVRWLLALTAPRIRQRSATMHRKLGLDDALLARTDGLLADALAGGRQRTRPALAAMLADRGVHAEGPRLASVLMHAELGGLVCSGALQGRQHTYRLLEEHVPPAPARSRDEALGELCRRYFASHGPATVDDLTWWSSLTVADARRGLDVAGPALDSTALGGRIYWSAAPPAPTAPVPVGDRPRAHLLQAYDEYVVAYRESRDVVGADALAPARGARRPVHPLVLDGRLAARWRREVRAGSMTVELELARTLDDAEEAAVDAAAGRHGAFVGLPVAVVRR